MKIPAIAFALLHLSSLCYGAPGSPYVEARRTFESPVYFIGAGAYYTLLLPYDGSNFTISNPLSVSRIITDPIPGTCTFYGIDGSVTVVPVKSDVEVGPPQTLVSGTCAISNPARKPRQVVILEASTTFIGAGPDPPTYSQIFVTGGTVQSIDNPLSVSQIRISDDSGPGGIVCTFFGIDGSETVVPGGETVDVGPPQAQVSATCEVAA